MKGQSMQEVSAGQHPTTLEGVSLHDVKESKTKNQKMNF